MFTRMFWTDVTLLVFCALFLGVISVDYAELEEMGLACPDRNSCTGYNSTGYNNTGYDEPWYMAFQNRSCECDPDCTTYRDCCIDAEEMSSTKLSVHRDFECLQYGYSWFMGVYTVSRCDDEWTGPEEIKQKCEGPTDFSDLASAAPVTSPTQRITYRNRHCAECNHAGNESLESFQYEYTCKELRQAPREEIMKRVTYNYTKKTWGVNVWWEDDEDPTFVECEVLFDLPAHLNDSVRFCRANIVTDCAQDWTDPLVRKSCREYMSLVYDKQRHFRNPHCAICNHWPTQHLSCGRRPMTGVGRKPIHFDGDTTRRFSFDKLLNITPRRLCSEGQRFDRFIKKCRTLRCALPGYVIRNNKCVKPD